MMDGTNVDVYREFKREVKFDLANRVATMSSSPSIANFAQVTSSSTGNLFGATPTSSMATGKRMELLSFFCCCFLIVSTREVVSSSPTMSATSAWASATPSVTSTNGHKDGN